MKKIYFIFISIALLAASVAACKSGGDGNSNQPPPEVLMQDDFSDPASGWSTLSDEEGINDYYQGGFRILVNRENFYFWSNPDLSYGDATIEVDARKLAGPDENDYGVICRYQPEAKNFYFFTISSDGYYGVSKYIDGDETLIDMTELARNTDVIQGGEATNHIKVTCEGDHLILDVNGTVLVDVKDGDLTSGDIGLIAGSYDTPGVDILFDNLVVTKP